MDEHFFDVQLTFLGGAGFGARFGVSCIDWDIFEDVLDVCADPFVVPFVIVVDADFRTADEGRDGGLSFFCGLAGVSLPRKNKKHQKIIVIFLCCCHWKRKPRSKYDLTVWCHASASNAGWTWFSSSSRASINNARCCCWCGHCTSRSWWATWCDISRSWSYYSCQKIVFTRRK